MPLNNPFSAQDDEFGAFFQKPKTQQGAPDEPLADQEAELTENMMFESVSEELITEAIKNSAEVHTRSNAMAAIFTFADEGMNTAEELDAMALGLADVDDDGDVSEQEQDDYEEALNALGDALEFLGLGTETIEKALADDDDAAEEAALFIANFMDELDDEDTYIANYSVREKLMMEAVRKVVRNGKIKWIKKPLRKRRRTAAQKAALKKARRKSNTGAARRARKKSMRVRKQAGA